MMWIEHIPAIVRVFLVLGIVMALLKVKVPLSYSLFIGGIFLAIFFHMTPRALALSARNGIFSIDTISLVVIVCGILILSNSMSVSGRLDRIVGAFKKVVGESRISLVTFPALIGLLPMPGGAVFSAPMVGAVSQNSTLEPQHKTVINFWFRHIWEYWFPLYPGVILAIELTQVPAWKFILIGMPMTLVSLTAGYIVILHGVTLSDKVHRQYSWDNIKTFLKELVPILLMVFTLLALGILINILEAQFDFKSKLLERSPIIIGLILSISWVAIADKLSWPQLRSILLKKSVWEIAILVISIMMFREILKDSGGVLILRDELLTYNIPIIGLVMVLPFVAGLVTGIAVGFVGTSFPVVMALLATASGEGQVAISSVFLAYVFGYMGMMLSPVHLCLLLTKDYFKANLAHVYYAYLIPVVVAALVPALGLYALYRMLGI